MVETRRRRAHEIDNGLLRGVRIAGKPSSDLWDLQCEDGCINSILPHKANRSPYSMVETPSLGYEPLDSAKEPSEDNITRPYSTDASGHENSVQNPLVIPSLCHPHIHLDKCFLLSHPKFSDLAVERGDFAEALSLTNTAKARFEHDDLMERGRALIEESIGFGVTSMRAFTEVDLTVELKCLKAGLALKEEFKDRCHIQICAFAQDPLLSDYSGDNPAFMGLRRRDIFREAVSMEGVDVVGSTPYVEKDDIASKLNISWVTDLAIQHKKQLDFHLDYNLDRTISPAVWDIISVLKRWIERKQQAKTTGVSNDPFNETQTCLPMVTLGHCTRLTLFSPKEWQLLRDEIEKHELPISFVGLPTSDMFMMGRPNNDDRCGQRVRGTLQIAHMIRDYGLNCAIGINNVGNAFTPQGSCDPLALASLGVGIYQAGTKADAELLLECVSSRARKVIGLGTETGLELKEGDPADFIVFGTSDDKYQGFRRRKSVHDIVYDAGTDRMVFKGGKVVSE